MRVVFHFNEIKQEENFSFFGCFIMGFSINHQISKIQNQIFRLASIRKLLLILEKQSRSLFRARSDVTDLA
jgi:hypothetical protein